MLLSQQNLVTFLILRRRSLNKVCYCFAPSRSSLCTFGEQEESTRLPAQYPIRPLKQGQLRALHLIGDELFLGRCDVLRTHLIRMWPAQSIKLGLSYHNCLISATLFSPWRSKKVFYFLSWHPLATPLPPLGKRCDKDEENHVKL